MTGKMIAYCGLVCSECEAFVATQKNDMDALKRMAEKASQEFGLSLKPEDSMCDGCIGNGRQIGYCNECAVRLCAIERGVVNCAHCDDYGCDKLTGFWQHAPKAKAALEEIRRAAN